MTISLQPAHAAVDDEGEEREFTRGDDSSGAGTGVRMSACEISRDLMGINESKLVAGLECGRGRHFLADSLKARTNLFI
jgi:DsrE/DsrF/DrsH-like family